MTFSDARTQCVVNNGDLPSIENSADLEDVISNITAASHAAANSTGVEAVWVGLRQRRTSGPLEWTNENTIPYNMHYYDFVGFWESGETFLSPCVKMTVATKKWRTVSCDVTLPFVCLQIPPVPEVTQPSFTAAEPLSASQQAATMNLALLIVMPIFLACYGGSCVAYMVYKIYRNYCRPRAKSHVVNLDSMETPPPPAAIPTYMHAPGQPLPPPVKPQTLPDGPAGFGKTPARYEAPPGRAEDVPIAEILMTKMAQKSHATAY